MRSVLPSVLGLGLFLAGLLSAALLRALPPSTPYFWLLPALLICCGILAFRLDRRWEFMLVSLAALVLVFSFIFWQPETDALSGVVTDSQRPLQTLRLQVPEKFQQGALAAPRRLEIQEGLQISVFAAGLDKPRMLTFSPAGDLYVSLSRSGVIAVLPNADRDGVADRVGIPFEKGQPSGPPQDIVRGWLQGHSAWGRPVSPAVGPDGALYLSDDRAGAIYRISVAQAQER